MTSSRRRFLLPALLCAILASLPFFLGLGGGFVFDDESNIVNNPGIQMQTLDTGSLYRVAFGLQPGGITRVLPTLSFALDYWRGNGFNPAVFKATNIGIHALTAFALAWLFHVLLLTAGTAPARARMAALALATAWAVHPLQVSSVLYVVQRMQTMCTLFLILALLAYLHARKAQIEGRSGRIGWLLATLCWVLALGCKEDSALLPAYTLALELTVLGFAASNTGLARTLRRGYLLAATLGTALFLFVVMPHFWQWDAYPGRDFSSGERLLTQGRVLCMYLWEILLPLPSHMPFYYDWLQPSRGFLQPWTTLPAIGVILGLLTAAWRLRRHRPLFALGAFLFFAGHFIASNIIGLELAFEHRNHFPLVGGVLAIGDLLALIAQRLKVHPAPAVATSIALLALLVGATAVRARTWDDPLVLARTSTMLAPHSARAWNSLCRDYYMLGGGRRPDNPYLGKAIDTCDKGATAAPYSITSLTNLLVFKTLQGSAGQSDWDRYLARLRHVTMGPENRQTLVTLFNNAANNVALDEDGIFKAIDIVAARGQQGRDQLSSIEYASIGYFILTETQQPERAYPFFVRALETAPPHAALPRQMLAELEKQGRADWARKLEGLVTASSQQQASQ